MSRALTAPVIHNAKPPAAQVVISQLLHSWHQPERRAAFYALAKAAAVIAALWEHVWLWHTKFYSYHYADVPISIAWSLLTVIAFITVGQIGCSAVLKARGTRLRRIDAHVSRQLTSMLAAYISNGDFEDELNRFAGHSTRTFEACMTSALLSTRGVAHERLCELPAMAILRDRWIESLHKRGEKDRRYAVEHLALLHDPQATMALEYALEDNSDGVVAAAIRGLLSMPGYRERDALVESLPHRSFLIRVLTAGESLAEVQKESEQALARAPRVRPATASHRRDLLLRRQQELQIRAQAVEEAIQLRRTDTARVGCSVLAASGSRGRDLLHSLSAKGTAGDHPAEAMGAALAAAARGGRT